MYILIYFSVSWHKENHVLTIQWHLCGDEAYGWKIWMNLPLCFSCYSFSTTFLKTTCFIFERLWIATQLFLVTLTDEALFSGWTLLIGISIKHSQRCLPSCATCGITPKKSPGDVNFYVLHLLASSMFVFAITSPFSLLFQAFLPFVFWAVPHLSTLHTCGL